MSCPDPQEVLRYLIDRPAGVDETDEFSALPGIYGVFFLGSVFPQLSGRNVIKSGDLIYIGKTESSQIDRDLKQHLAAGETGRSTLRRSLGALLVDDLSLRPEPRSSTETSDRRFLNYRFDPGGEARLTEWMRQNLGFSFYEYNHSPSKIKSLEIAVIQLATPILNLEYNRSSPYYSEIQAARRRCVIMARNNELAIPGSISSVPAAKAADEPVVVGKPKLHEVMTIILKGCTDRTATFKEVSSEIARRGLYRQQAGGIAPPSQIRLRARNYGHLFEIIRPDRVRLRP